MKKISLLFLALTFCSVAFAADLEDRLAKARADKAVVEQSSGYLKAVSSAKDIVALVDEVNEKRKQKYKEVASQTSGATIQTVEQAAGQKLMEKYK